MQVITGAFQLVRVAHVRYPSNRFAVRAASTAPINLGALQCGVEDGV